MVINENIALNLELSQELPSEMAWHYHIIPKEKDEDVFKFFISEAHLEEDTQDELETILGLTVELESKPEEVIQKALGKFYRKSGAQGGQSLSTGASKDFVSKILYEAKALGSSDIHIEIYDDSARIRIRIDGGLIEKYKLELDEYPEIVNKIKILSNLDITEKRRPQDGRITFPEFDVRVSILPTLHGEKIVMRILGNDASSIDISSLGMDEKERKDYLEGIKKPNGIMLISGPTGSGKTTTLYATLKILNEEKRNIVTVEDPIEYTLEGINQVQVKESIGLTFASALRSFLRQDPDIIMLGEIRDAETAKMAVKAALTGHLVLSTIHTNSAWDTVSRLIDMGVEPFLLASTLNTSVAQRLVKKLCPNCKEKVKLSNEDLPPGFDNHKALNHFYKPVGCSECYFTGYNGRRALYEIISIDSELSDKIKSTELKVTDTLQEKGVRTLADQAYNLLADGTTSLEDVYSLLNS